MNILSSIKLRNSSVLVSVITILTLSAGGLFAFSQSGSAQSSAAVLTFTPVADSYVNQSSPTNNWGTSNTLYVDGSPLVRSYLRFNVTGVTTGTVTKVTLRIYANSKSSAGLSVNKVTDTAWQETAINYNNAPAMGSMVGTSPAVSAVGWVAVDVTSSVQANGLLSLAVLTSGSTAINMSARESGANAPQLVVETNSGSSPTQTPTSTRPPATSTPTNPPAPTATGVPPTSTRTPTATSPAPTPTSTSPAPTSTSTAATFNRRSRSGRLFTTPGSPSRGTNRAITLLPITHPLWAGMIRAQPRPFKTTSAP